jgi:hypothetical protein
MYNEPNENKIICKTFIDDDKIPVVDIDDKKLRELRIDTLLYVKQYKNTYYKYTNKEKFNHELYNTFLNDKNFDGGDSGYDDDDEIRIFDRYILEYVKNRSDVMTFLLCKNKDVILKNRIDELVDIYDNKSNTIDILFTIDMSEKDLFNYCYGIISKEGQLSSIKNIVFSLICKYKGEYVRMKLSAFTNDKKNHPYIILESFLT